MKRASNLSIILAVLLLVAACSSEPAASSAQSADAATPTPAPTATAPAGESGIPLPSLPSFGEGAGNLADVVPDVVGGHIITYQHMTGDDPAFTEDIDDEALDFLERLDASPSDITTAFGFGGDFAAGAVVGISAFQVAGADETRLRDEYISILQDDDDIAPQPATIAGKNVFVFSDDEDEEAFNALYSRGDTLWIVFASAQELLEDALGQLP